MKLLMICGLGLISLNACSPNKTEVGSWLTDQADVIDYRGIRTEARKNKVKSEMDK